MSEESIVGGTENIEAQQSNENVKPAINTEDMLKRSHKSKTATAARIRAITNFEKGIEDPEFNVKVLSNGQYRVSKRKEACDHAGNQGSFIKSAPAPSNNPIAVNQIAENKPAAERNLTPPPTQPAKTKAHDPFSDIVYYNINNQLNEQINKRLDMVTAELERLRNKNKKLKGKYKNLKQAIYITDDEDEEIEQDTVQQEQQQAPQQQISQPEPEIQQYQIPIANNRSNILNFNRFFQ